MSNTPGEVTLLLHAVAKGDVRASERLYELLHGQLRAMAGGILRGERPGHTLVPTALVSEVWLRLSASGPTTVNDRQHFLAIAARAMRQVLVDHARRRNAARRGGAGDWRRIPLEDAEVACDGEEERRIDVLDLHEALARLEELDPRQARIAELRAFGGLTVPEVAELLGVSARTVEDDWAMARAWLRRRLLPQ